MVAKDNKALDDIIDEFVVLLNRRQVKGSSDAAKHTVLLLSKVAKLAPDSQGALELIEKVREVGVRLMKAVPQELAIGNIVRRVLYLIRMEYDSAKKMNGLSRTVSEMSLDSESVISMSDRSASVFPDSQVSLYRLLDQESGDRPSHGSLFPVEVEYIRAAVLAGIEEIRFELGQVETHCAEFAIEHIHASELILTFGRSATVSTFLEEASKFREFQVFVAESAPSFEGQTMAKSLAKKGIDTTIITDGAVFALMARTNKVLVGAHAVLANGGIIAHSGAYNLALAAHYHSVPFVVVTGLYKLCPMYAFEQDSINDQNPPSQIIPFDEGCLAGLEMENPAFDYIPPEFVTLFITNVGGHNPSYIYRLLSEFYRPEDHDLI